MLRLLRNVKVVKQFYNYISTPKKARPLRTKGNALLKRFVFRAVILRFLYKNAVQSPPVPSPLIVGAGTQTGAETGYSEKMLTNANILGI